jgi:hypothetical protein
MNNAILLAFAKDFCKDNGITAGLKHEEITAMAVGALCDAVFTEASDDDKQKAYAVLYPLMNTSAFRQKLESAGILKKSEVKSRGADPSVLANKWFKPAPAEKTEE